MPRYQVFIEYDGGPFQGWQRQDNGPSVQEALEDAIKGLCGQDIRSHAAGRTDSGVHAFRQCAHFDLPKDYGAQTVQKALNYHLKPQPVVIVEAHEVTEDFHARFSAQWRQYLYRILNRPAPAALEAGRVWHVPIALDAEAMHEAAQVLVGHHDFSTFRASYCQAKSPEKTLTFLNVERVGAEIHVHVQAPSFLHHQVRNFVGTLKLVGEGKWTKADLEQALAAKDRKAGGPTAPPTGLYFADVGYGVGH